MERFYLTLKECDDASGKKILDIGCGPGRIAVELARRGAYVVGIDFSQKMINLANLLSKKYELENKCMFVCDDFMRHVFNEDFDISLALGFFDYTEDPVPYLKRMKSLTKEKCIMSFPSKFPLAIIRMIWLKKRKCPVYFYTKHEIKTFLSDLFFSFEIKNISAGYFCVAFV